MKGHISTIYITIIAAMLTIAGYDTLMAQDYVNTPVEISKEKVRIDGKVCYSHVVQEKQTLFSISKAYEVSIDDIYRFNPDVKENGLKKNAIIIIPSKDALKKETEAATKNDEKHSSEVIKESQPTETAAVTETKSVSNTKSQRVHVAKWYEDLNMIAAHYGVSAEEIMKANGLASKKLNKRHKLIIPYPGEVTVAATEIVQREMPSDSTTVETVPADTATTAIETVTPAYYPKQKVDATVIMPLTTAAGEPNRNNRDFYCGVLLAVYDMSEEGIDCNLNVYDIMDRQSQFSVEAIKGSDVVIGPVSSADLTRLFFATNNVNAVVSPLDPRAERLTKEHRAMIQAPTPHIAQYKDLVNWIGEEYSEGDKVLIITEKGARLSGITSQMKEALDSSSLAYNTFSYSILEGRDITEPLTALMSTEGANRVIVASESEAFVNDVVRNLNLLIYNNIDIVLYAPSKIRSFETIEVENFHNTSMHVSLGYYIDYESDNVKSFLKRYRALFNTEPTQFAFQGYDIARYFIGLSAEYGENWKNHLTDESKDMLQSTFQFTRPAVGGYINSGVRRIIYDKGYEILKIR